MFKKLLCFDDQSKKARYELLYALFWAAVILIGAKLIAGHPEENTLDMLLIGLSSAGWLFTRHWLPNKS